MIVSDDLVNRESVEQHTSLAGFSSMRHQVIATRPNDGPDYMADTVLQNCQIKCLRASGVDLDDDVQAGLTEGVEERFIKAATGPLLQTLRDNPELLDYLIDGVWPEPPVERTETALQGA